MSLVMLTVTDIFFPTSPNDVDNLVKFNISPIKPDRFFSNGMNYIKYHKILLTIAIGYFIWDAFFVDITYKCLVCMKCLKPRVKEFAQNQGTFTNEIKKIELDGLSTYNLLKNEDYKSVYLAYADFTSELGQ
jgi:hypothetical protein